MSVAGTAPEVASDGNADAGRNPGRKDVHAVGDMNTAQDSTSQPGMAFLDIVYLGD